MEGLISNLLHRFERGALSRRELVQGLAMLTAASATPAFAEGPGFKLARLGHVGIQVSDVAKSAAFYQNALGFTVSGLNPQTGVAHLAIDNKSVISIHQKQPSGIVDHIGLGVDNFNKDAVTQALKARGVAPVEGDAAGFHVVDPDGIKVQLS